MRTLLAACMTLTMSLALHSVGCSSASSDELDTTDDALTNQLKADPEGL